LKLDFNEIVSDIVALVVVVVASVVDTVI